MLKKITLITFLSVITLLSFSQTQRMVLWEEFTSGSCGPCAGVNPQISTFWNNNPEMVIGIQYHMSWPAANDPMYLNNPGDNDSRRGVYGVSSIPFAAIDGNRFADNVGSVQTLINIVQSAYNDDPAEFDLQLNYELNDTQDKLTVTAMITAVSDVTGLNSNLYLPVIEKFIHLPSSQPNGEQDFHNVLKALVPSSSGTQLPSEWENGDYMIFQYTWDVFGFYDISEVGLVGFMQNTGSSKAVDQAAYGSTDPITPNFTNDAAILDINTPQVLCNNSVSPTITIRNQGSSSLTNATIVYSVNGETPMTYDWTGNLNFLDSESITLPAIDYTFAESYNISVNIENPNSSGDDYDKNNAMDKQIYQSAFLPQNCKIAILTDDNPEETTWDIKNSSGDIIASGGPYAISSIFIEDFTWTSNDCFTFSIYDAANNGMSGGFYKLLNPSSQVLWAGNNNFTDKATAEFSYDELMSISQTPLDTDIHIYPNPIIETAQMEFSLLEQSTVVIDIFNILGKKVENVFNGKMPAGKQNIELNTQSFESGTYFVKLKINNTIINKKISLQK